MEQLDKKHLQGALYDEIFSCRIYFLFTFLCVEMNAFAQGTAGLSTPAAGALGIAQGNNFVARADDASAIHFNPAGLTQLEDKQISLGATFILNTVEYQGEDISEDMGTRINTIPNFYFAAPIVKNKFAAGLGVTVPYGLQGSWDDEGFARFVVTDFDLRVININPTLAFKPFPFLSIGVGLDYHYAELDLSKRVNVGLINSVLTGSPPDLSTPEGFQDTDVHGDAFGYNTGILFNITPRHSIGISFRSKADINFEGKLKLSNLSGATAQIFGSEKFDSRTKSTLTLPEMLSFGYAYRHNALWSIEVDVQWTNWSRIDVIKSSFEPTNPLLEASKEDVRKWNNTFSIGIGGEYKLNEALKARGGYVFHETPIPNESFEPSVPQGSRHGVFAGIGYSWGKKMDKIVDFASGIIIGEDRNVHNTVGDSVQGLIDGNYDSIAYVITVNFNYKF